VDIDRFSELVMTKDDKEPRRRQYPPVYEKTIPLMIVIIGVVIILLVLVILGVILGLFPV
jgi:hypothetical protein